MDRKIFSYWFTTHLALLSLLFNDVVSSFPSGYNDGPKNGYNNGYNNGHNGGYNNGHGSRGYGMISNLDYRFYDRSCPRLQMMVKSGVWRAFKDDSRIAASLLRLHFHDCFVNVSYGTYSFHAHTYVTVDHINHTLYMTIYIFWDKYD